MEIFKIGLSFGGKTLIFMKVVGHLRTTLSIRIHSEVQNSIHTAYRYRIYLVIQKIYVMWFHMHMQTV